MKRNTFLHRLNPLARRTANSLDRRRGPYCPRRLGVESLESRRLLAAILFDPGDYAGAYTVGGLGPVTGATSIDLTEGDHTLSLSGVTPSISFNVDPNGDPTPSSIDVMVAPNTYTFLLSAVPTIIVNAADDVDDGVADAAHTSLREAINLANSTVGVEERIIFGIPGTGPHAIALTSALPTVTNPVIIDGTSQPGYAGSPIIEVDGAAVAGYVLTITADDSTVQGLAITNASVGAIQLSGGSGNLLTALDLSWNLKSLKMISAAATGD